MPFALAEAFVDIGANTKPLDSALVGVKGSITSLGSVFGKLQGYATAAFAAMSLAGGFVVHAFADAEAASSSLRTALAATGQEVNNNYAKLDGLASNLEL